MPSTMYEMPASSVLRVSGSARILPFCYSASDSAQLSVIIKAWTHGVDGDDLAVRVVLLNGTRDAADSASSACARDDSVDFHRRRAVGGGRRGFNGRDHLRACRQLMGSRVVDLGLASVAWQGESRETYVAVLVQDDGVRNFALKLLGHTYRS
jgi:hypothetical protein